MSKAQEIKQSNYHFMAQGLRRLELALQGRLEKSGVIPPEWQAIARGGGDQAKVKLTLWVEADVLKFFRAMGRGHTTRMADVLKTFMHARLAGVVTGPEDVDYSYRYTEEERQKARDMLAELRARIREDRLDWKDFG